MYDLFLVKLLFLGSDVPTCGYVCHVQYMLHVWLFIYYHRCCHLRSWGWWVCWLWRLGLPGGLAWSYLYICMFVLLIIRWHLCQYGHDAECPSNRWVMPNFLQNWKPSFINKNMNFRKSIGSNQILFNYLPYLNGDHFIILND